MTQPRPSAPPPVAPPWRRAVLSWLDPADPHPVRGPFTRWPRSADTVLAVVVWAVSLVTVSVSALEDDAEYRLDAIGDLPIGALLLLGIAAGALLGRRHRPLVTAGSILVVMLVWAAGGYGDGHELALVVAVYSSARHLADRRIGAAVMLAAIAVDVLGTVIDSEQRIDVAPAILVLGLAWYVGRAVRNRHDHLTLLEERAAQLEAEQAARAERAVADERARIARELHDVVAHQVSMMTVQAGAAKTIVGDDPEAAAEAMGDVERAGRQALGELRHLLGVLRDVADDADRLAPQPGLADLHELARSLRPTGAEVTVELADLPADLPAALELSAYRIAQEALTNVVKHAGAGPSVCLTTRVDDDLLTLEIVNTTETPPRELPDSGFGLLGMRERAGRLGGTLCAGPDGTARFRVVARLPLRPEPT